MESNHLQNFSKFCKWPDYQNNLEQSELIETKIRYLKTNPLTEFSFKKSFS